MIDDVDIRLGVVGLGYVGLPLAVEFSRHFPVTGFDINQLRIDELNRGIDRSNEVAEGELKADKSIIITSDISKLSQCNVYVITVPTPVDDHKQPDLSPLISASSQISGLLKSGDVVIYESTVFPGATEEICVPELEIGSGLVYNQDFFVGYSPERINPGDKKHTLTNTVKVTAGSNPDTADFVDGLYQSIITSGTFKASSIAVAEAAKVIENTQRDVNIALINELALIFERLNIDTQEVLKAAGTKWNFLPFHPGLVGGHCIGVDPYYLTHKAQEMGYQPIIIPASRTINESMGPHVATRVVKLMARNGSNISSAKALVLGLSFKEDCPDLRNTKVIEIINELESYHISVDVYDPVVNRQEASDVCGVDLISLLEKDTYDAVIIAVAHGEFSHMSADDYRALCKNNGIIFDVKYVLPKDAVDGRL